jgi:hypothetical protein
LRTLIRPRQYIVAAEYDMPVSELNWLGGVANFVIAIT